MINGADTRISAPSVESPATQEAVVGLNGNGMTLEIAEFN
jgi:hypothetical protein